MNLEIPKNVREALQKQVPREAHPAADLLNAYAERSLSASEDALIAGHLAACRDCREVVFLAASAIESPIETTETPAAEPRGVTWWRWAMPATALLAIAAAVIVMGGPWLKEAPPAGVAKVVQSTPAVADNASQPAAATAQPAKALAKTSSHEARESSLPATRDSKAALKKDLYPAAAKTAASPTAVPMQQQKPFASGVLTATRAANALPDYQGNAQNQNYAGGPSQRANITNSVASSTVEVSSQATAIDTQTSNAYGPVPPPPLPLDQTSAKLDAAPSAKVNARGSKPALQFSFGPTETKRNPISRMAIQFWRITADGHVEHFIQNSWNRALGGVQKTFRVVAYLQNHVWAGGVGPELYHSADNGQTWNTTRVRSVDAELSGTMQSIRALDEKHVAIVADDGSLWVTNDGGKTWDKQ